MTHNILDDRILNHSTIATPREKVKTGIKKENQFWDTAVIVKNFYFINKNSHIVRFIIDLGNFQF